MVYFMQYFSVYDLLCFIFRPPFQTIFPCKQGHAPVTNTVRLRSDTNRNRAQRELRHLQLQSIGVRLWLDVSGVKQELVGGNRKQRFGKFPYLRNQEVVHILTGDHHRRLLFADALHGVADVLDCGEIGQK